MFTLTRISRYTTDPQGNPLKTKEGKPYERVTIQVSEKPDVWIRGFGNALTNTWNEGDKVDIEITENGQYTNFKTPNKTDKLAGELSSILTRLDVIEAKLGFGPGSIKDTASQMKEEVSDEDIAF